MKTLSTSRTPKLLLLVLTLILVSCASTAPPSVIALPQPAKPQVPSLLMKKEPPPSNYQKRLQMVFDQSLKTQTEK